MIPPQTRRLAWAFAVILALGRCQGKPSVAIVDVTVINPADGTRREHVTVVTRGDRIIDVGDVRPPRGATVIDGRGRFLLPGFWDMHVHVLKPAALPVYLASGITGIRNMGGRLLELQRWRREIESGTLQGPRMFISGPILDGPRVPRIPNSIPLENEADVMPALRGLQQAKVDFVSVNDGLSRELFFAVMIEAKQRHLTVAGNVPDAVSPIEASNAGMRSIEQLDGIVDGSAFPTFVENETWQVPMLAARRSQASLHLVEEMRKAGVKLMAGTDGAASLHDELELFVLAGLSPMDALRAATAGPAEFFERNDMGTIAPGAVADLVLLSADPTISIENTRRVAATIAAGRLYDPAAR